jgi:hypothetical protein
METKRNKSDMTTAFDMEPVPVLKYIEPEITMTEIRI